MTPAPDGTVSPPPPDKTTDPFSIPEMPAQPTLLVVPPEAPYPTEPASPADLPPVGTPVWGEA